MEANAIIDMQRSGISHSNNSVHSAVQGLAYSYTLISYIFRGWESATWDLGLYTAVEQLPVQYQRTDYQRGGRRDG